MAKLMGIIKIPMADGSRPPLKNLIYSALFAWSPPKVASLSFALTFIMLWLGLMCVLYRRKIFIKV
jgi:predicted acyltransferase